MTHSSSFKRIGLIGVLCCLVFAADRSLVAAAKPGASAATVIYVATHGSDQWSGRLPAPTANQQDGPLATLACARDAIRQLRSANALPGGAVVMILDGIHHLSEPLVLTHEDSGTQKQPITYTAY